MPRTATNPPNLGALALQTNRIRRRSGVSEPVARTMALLAFGEPVDRIADWMLVERPVSSLVGRLV